MFIKIYAMRIKYRFLIIILLVLSTGCSSSLEDTKWISIDKNDHGVVSMEKEVTFTNSKYTLLNKYISSGVTDTITGTYKYSGESVKLSYDNNKGEDTALVRNDSLILGEGNEGYLVFKKQKQ